MDAEIAVIGGVGFTLEGVADEVETAYGPVPAFRSRIKTKGSLSSPAMALDTCRPIG